MTMPILLLLFVPSMSAIKEPQVCSFAMVKSHPKPCDVMTTLVFSRTMSIGESDDTEETLLTIFDTERD